MKNILCIYLISLCCGIFKKKKYLTLFCFRFAVFFIWYEKSLMLNSTTRNPVELLGPCFKTGRIAAPSLQHNILRIIHIGYLRNSLLASKKKMQRRSVRLYFAEFLQILITSTQRERVRVCYFLLLKFATMILCKAISLSLSLPLEQLNVVEGLTS